MWKWVCATGRWRGCTHGLRAIVRARVRASPVGGVTTGVRSASGNTSRRRACGAARHKLAICIQTSTHRRVCGGENDGDRELGPCTRAATLSTHLGVGFDQRCGVCVTRGQPRGQDRVASPYHTTHTPLRSVCPVVPRPRSHEHYPTTERGAHGREHNGQFTRQP